MFKDIWFFAEGYRSQLVFFFILIVILSTITLAPPYLFGRIIDDLTTRVFDNIIFFLLLTAVATIAHQVLHNIIVYYTKTMSSLIRNNVKIISFDYLFKMHYAYYEDNPMGRLLARIDNGSNGLREAVKKFYKFSFFRFFNVVFILIIMFTLDFTVAIISLIIMGIFSISVYFRSNKEAHLKSKIYTVAENVYSKVLDFMQYIQIVKFLNVKDKLLNILDNSYKEIIVKEKAAFLYERVTSAAMKLIIDLGSVVVLGYLAYALYIKSLSIGVVVMLYTYFNRLNRHSRMLWGDYHELIEHRTQMYRMSLIFDDKPDILEPKKSKKVKSWEKLSFKNIFFKYSSKKTDALKNISFNIVKGERIAIVGVSGSGKSTLAKLLLRMYLPQKGIISVGNVNINNVKSKDLYNLIKIVPQENQLINTTIRMNLQIAAKGKLTKQNTTKSLKLSQAHNFVNSLPKKLATIVGPNGVKLSGGEKQRICLARALLSEPEILVLDEATSHLDVIAEKEIYESLKQLPKKTTLIAITHRIASAAAFKKIIVMHNGKIEGIGSHKDLLKNKYYKKLWLAQHKK